MDSAMLGNGLVLNQITPPVHPSHKRGHLVRRKHPKKSKEVHRWVLAFPAVVSVYHTFCFLRVKAENPASLYDKLAGHSALSQVGIDF